jgi:hypothetical protein
MIVTVHADFVAAVDSLVDQRVVHGPRMRHNVIRRPPAHRLLYREEQAYQVLKAFRAVDVVRQQYRGPGKRHARATGQIRCDVRAEIDRPTGKSDPHRAACPLRRPDGARQRATNWAGHAPIAEGKSRQDGGWGYRPRASAAALLLVV